jgi:chromosomal replication initiation ATPase DnaA
VRRWTKPETERLYALAGAGLSAIEIASVLQRSIKTVRAFADRNLLKLARHTWKPDPPTSAHWTEADKIAQWARVPHDLATLVVQGARKFNVSVKWLRSESRDSELVKCRVWISCEARGRGHSYCRIARALNRDHTTVIHYLRSRISPLSTGRAVDSRFVPCRDECKIAA